jgi:hypothetical protein
MGSGFSNKMDKRLRWWDIDMVIRGIVIGVFFETGAFYLELFKHGLDCLDGLDLIFTCSVLVPGLDPRQQRRAWLEELGKRLLDELGGERRCSVNRLGWAFGTVFPLP